MLSLGDAELASRDPALPGLRVLLDAQAFVAMLSRLSGKHVTSATPTYCRYKVGTSCLVAYDVRVEPHGPVVPVYARTHGGADALGKVQKAAEYPATPGPLGPGVFTTIDPPCAIFVFPNDHELRVLARFSDAGERARLLRKAIPANAIDEHTTLEPLRYKPERRFAGRVRAADGTSYFTKVYDEPDAPACLGSARAFRSDGPLKVASLLGAHERRGVAAWEWIEGRPLLDPASTLVQLSTNAARFGEALHVLHRQTPSLSGAYTPQRLQEFLDESAAALAAIAPGCAPRAHALASRLRSALDTGDAVSLHGDCSAAQFLLTESSVAILDFDRAGTGPAAFDLGSFVANLEMRVILGELDRARADACATGLIDGYLGARAGAAASNRASLHAATQVAAAFALFRLAVEPFRTCTRNWPSLLEACLARAEVLHGRR
jgi:Phosphotransferase enzyme family